MKTVTIAIGAALVVGLYWFVVLPKLREFSWWDELTSRLWAMAGNSRTLAVGYLVEVLAILDAMKLIDWSSLLGVEKGGRIAAIMGLVMIALRLVTRSSVTFKAQ